MYRIIVFLLLSASPLTGQSIDTTKVFPLEDFLNWVRIHHPVMRQAALLDNQAQAALLKARGAFDPKVYADYEDKSFDSKNYWRRGEAGVKVPTWPGIDVKLAYTWNNGVFLNSDDNLPDNGQAIVGLEVPLARNLFFDKRRAEVQKAQLYRDANEAQRRILINDLLFSAVELYWKWAYAYQSTQIYEKALQLSKERFSGIRESFFQGDKPAIDTLEAVIQIQNRQLQLDGALLQFRNATLELSNFLWLEDLVPLQLSGGLRPQPLTSIAESIRTISGDALIRADVNHPKLRALRVKQEQLEIDERWQREAFKPELNLSYNFLGTGFSFNPAQNPESGFSDLFTENYKWGLTFNYPILWRKERGGLELVRLKQAELHAKLQNTRLEIRNKVSAVYQEMDIVAGQVRTQRQMLVNNQTLLEAENEKFRIGESSVFLLNSREQKLIETELKLTKLRVEFQKLLRKLDWALGELL